MNEELDVNEILTAMRNQIGAMAQENAILAARIKKLENGQVYSVGYASIPRDTIEQREKSWNCSEEIMRTTAVLCGDCIDKFPPPSNPPLARQNAELPHYAHEKYQVRCDYCNEKIIMTLTFSTDPCYYTYYNFD